MRLLRVFGADGWDADAEGRIMTHQPIGRLAMRSDDGSYALDQLCDDEVMVSPGWIYRRINTSLAEIRK